MGVWEGDDDTTNYLAYGNFELFLTQESED